MRHPNYCCRQFCCIYIFIHQIW